jgi:hypothetical protein
MMRVLSGLAPVVFCTVLVCAAVAATGCVGSRSAADQPPDVLTVRDLDASGDDPVYFSFVTGGVVGSDEAWDISFAGTSIGVSGEAQVLDRAFERIVEAPESGYRSDAEDRPAIGTEEGERWFDYDPNSHVVSPVPFRTIVIRTKEGRYAKVEIVDYYDGMGTPRFYTYRYAYQAAESRTLGRATT